MPNETENSKNQIVAECLGCGVVLSSPTEENKMGDEFICNNCREEMLDSLEGAWIKHSAFLDAALN
ncbi:MAG TPA: hypothetical protein VN739_10535 [Nitrososphaerales archaeon]|nr:hypothetical protein [Nitrososphaerales archaeon]